uniref:NADH-ubiquinone oxidoreductase chain 1 n=2 Tax=Mengenilla moldrzyki TaxID=1155016 RepID=J3RR32_MENMO|nr:NADH dehydrogenase subunit 1 [Mengenilla moldrzyki]
MMMMMDFLLEFVNYLVILVFMLMMVAFLTVFERKILGYIHLRKGPNKVGIMGVIQPFNDGVKLLCKELLILNISNYLIFLYSPLMNLFLVMLLWVMVPYMNMMDYFNMSFLFFLCCLGLNVYSVMMMGWSSNSKYSFLGSVRIVAQMISYEVSMMIFLLSLMMVIKSYSVMVLYKNQIYLWFIFFFIIIFMMMWLIFLIESNRTPYDFSEGESELVSGFNIDYSGGLFAFIFISEYMSIIFMSFMMVILFFGGNLFSFYFYLLVLLFMFMFLWIRGSLPRYRYDKLMELAWKIFLPVSLMLMLFYFCMMMLML